MLHWLQLGLQTIVGVAFLGAGILLAGLIPVPHPADEEDQGKGPLVEVVRVEVHESYSLPIVAYGTARAPRIYSIRPQVAGKVVEAAESFEEGKKVKAGDVLFRIDTRDLELAIAQTDARILEIEATMAQTRAEVAPLEAEVRRLRQSIADNEATLATRREAIERARDELAREERLRERGASSDVQVQQLEDKVNLRSQELQDAESTAAQLPLQIEAQEAQRTATLSNIQRLEAQRDTARSRRKQLELDLARTTVASPADGIVLLADPETGRSARRLTTGDVVSAGLDVAWLIPTEEGMEIPIPIRAEQARWIQDLALLLDYDADAPGPGVEGARVEWVADPRYVWEGRLLRFTGTIDTSTRRLTAIAHVRATGDRFVPEESVPLTSGMYCRILIPSVVHANVVVVSRRMVREGPKEGDATVLVVAEPGRPDAQGIRRGRLEVRPIEIVRRAGDVMVLSAGLRAGEFVVASPLGEVVPGMDLRFRDP